MEVDFNAYETRYGHDGYGQTVKPQKGYYIVPEGTELKKGDRAFDIYRGWINGHDYSNEPAVSVGRVTAWQRKITCTQS